jgi:hypothetical protein
MQWFIGSHFPEQQSAPVAHVSMGPRQSAQKPCTQALLQHSPLPLHSVFAGEQSTAPTQTPAPHWRLQQSL